MPTLKIEVRKEIETINQIFEEMVTKKWRHEMQIRVYKRIYLLKLNSLFALIKRKLGRWTTEQTNNAFTVTETGSEEYIEAEEKKLKKFLQTEHADLKSEPEYRAFLADRTVMRYVNYLKRRVLNKALESLDAAQFLNAIGITVNYRILKDDSESSSEKPQKS